MRAIILQLIGLLILAIVLFGFVCPWIANLTIFPGLANILIELVLSLIYIWLMAEVGISIREYFEKRP